MPFRMGFTRFRREALAAELERISAMFPQLGVQRAIVIGDVAAGRVGPESTLELIMVQDIPGSFPRRMDFFTSHLAPSVATVFYVYTPEEFQALQESSPFLRAALGRGRTVYES